MVHFSTSTRSRTSVADFSRSRWLLSRFAPACCCCCCCCSSSRRSFSATTSTSMPVHAVVQLGLVDGGALLAQPVGRAGGRRFHDAHAVDADEEAVRARGARDRHVWHHVEHRVRRGQRHGGTVLRLAQVGAELHRPRAREPQRGVRRERNMRNRSLRRVWKNMSAEWAKGKTGISSPFSGVLRNVSNVGTLGAACWYAAAPDGLARAGFHSGVRAAAASTAACCPRLQAEPAPWQATAVPRLWGQWAGSPGWPGQPVVAPRDVRAAEGDGRPFLMLSWTMRCWRWSASLIHDDAGSGGIALVGACARPVEPQLQRLRLARRRCHVQLDLRLRRLVHFAFGLRNLLLEYVLVTCISGISRVTAAGIPRTRWPG